MSAQPQTLTPPSPEILTDFPDAFEFLFEPWRYKVGYGGRGSSKSWSFARALLLHACWGTERILCARELQTSIAESVHQLLSDQIFAMGLSNYFNIQQQGIYRYPYFPGDRGSEFFFYGIKTNPTKVKSAEGITKVWVEEAEKVSSHSWEVLIPTIRQPDSEIWISFNPDEENDPTYQRYIIDKPPRSKVVRVNWHDNPYFPEVLREEKDYLARVDPEAYEHVWNGECRRNASSQIFRGKYTVEAFTPPDPNLATTENPMWDGPYFGADWGFAVDPTVCTKLWIDTKLRRLMVEYEAYAIGCELDDTPALFRAIPGVEQHTIRGDNSRPETISHIRNRGLRVEAAEKWSGSIEDGIAFLKNFTQIVIHPRCKHHIEEARLYSYKKDRLTGDVLTDIVDRHNHCWDADRYALQPMIMAGTSLGIWARL